MKDTFWAAILLCLSISWMGTGCASRGDASTNAQFNTKSQPFSFENVDEGEVDLITLIDPEERRLRLDNENCAEAERRTNVRDQAKRRKSIALQLECAVQAFRTYSVSAAEFSNLDVFDVEKGYTALGSSVALAIRRNEVQDRLILRSDVLCRDFQHRINITLNVENDTNLGNWVRNSQSRLVGGVGGLLLGGDILWALTNATRITDLPTYTQDLGKIEKTVLKLALEGMISDRKEKLRSIDKRRHAPPRHGGIELNAETGEGITPVSSYSLERAIGDAVEYHHACSIYNGLNHSLDTVIERGPNVGEHAFPDLFPSSIN